MNPRFTCRLIAALLALTSSGCLPHPDDLPFINKCEFPVKIIAFREGASAQDVVILKTGDSLNVKYTCLRLRAETLRGKTLFDQPRYLIEGRLAALIPLHGDLSDVRFAIMPDGVSLMTLREWKQFQQAHDGRLRQIESPCLAANRNGLVLLPPR